MTNPTIHLREAVVTEGLATPRFFNGRLLSGEALTQLQSSEQAQRQRLGRALGPGVIDGLWVRDAHGATPTLRVLAGEALTARGEVLRLAQDVEVALHAAPTGGAGAEAEGAGFHARPQEAPPNVAAVPGVFVLIAGLTQQPRGRAPASGGAGDGRCNVREDVEGVSFRLASVVSPSPLDPTSERLRGQVAALCFGMEGGVDPSVRAYGPPCLLAEEAVRPTEVALAVVQVDGDG